ncbi:hypothetical protein ABZ896_16995 [Streptomyces sp. NPDC047072]|uniref:hypothetical protein n=1 Tax=Streptomyces sp. NPDC047072 TaxID=3154809 RepID=UPI0033DE0176
MSWLKKILNAKQDSTEDEVQQYEEAVIITFDLSEERGTEEEVKQAHELSDELNKLIAEKSAGEYDGDEFGGHECTLYMYGPSADALLEAINPALEKSTFKPIRVLRRYGSVDDAAARETKTRIA